MDAHHGPGRWLTFPGTELGSRGRRSRSFRHGLDVLDRRAALPVLSGLASGLASGSVPAVLTLGMIVLIATPIVRVTPGLYYFRKVGERAMTEISLTVLVLLLLGILVIGPHVR